MVLRNFTAWRGLINFFGLFLWIGTTLLYFQFSGSTSSRSNELKIHFDGKVNSLIIRINNLSHPSDLSTLALFIITSASPLFISIKINYLSGLHVR